MNTKTVGTELDTMREAGPFAESFLGSVLALAPLVEGRIEAEAPYDLASEDGSHWLETFPEARYYLSPGDECYGARRIFPAKITFSVDGVDALVTWLEREHRAPTRIGGGYGLGSYSVRFLGQDGGNEPIPAEVFNDIESYDDAVARHAANKLKQASGHLPLSAQAS